MGGWGGGRKPGVAFSDPRSEPVFLGAGGNRWLVGGGVTWHIPRFPGGHLKLYLHASPARNSGPRSFHCPHRSHFENDGIS